MHGCRNRSSDGSVSYISYVCPTLHRLLTQQLGRGGRKHARFVWASQDLSRLYWRKANRPLAEGEEDR